MSVTRLKNYVNGQWVDPPNAGTLDIENPSSGEIVARVPLSTAEAVSQAVDAAHAAFPAWSNTPVARRCEHLFKLVGLMQDHFEEISRGVTEEMGKSLPDARAEVKRALENVEVACGMPTLQQGDKLIGAAADIDGEVLRVPVGVFGMIAPFNFPAMVPFWFMPYALATGNTYVLKPSEIVPCSQQRIAALIHEAGFPPGVFNLVNGDKVVGETLLANEKVAGISSVGATATARAITEACAKHGKRCQAFGGAKNYLVVMPDAKTDQVVRNMLTSCYGCAGQRCMAASAIACVGDETYQTVVKEFLAASKEVIVADPLDPAVANESMVMGPVISAAAKSRILGLIDTGVKEGATLALDGRDIRVPGREKGHFIGPTVFTDVKPGMTVERTEIFGPVVVITKCDSFDHAISVINSHQYGNGASIYTQNGYYARRFKLEAQYGMIGINIGIPAPVACLPFGGMKASVYADIKAQSKAIIDFFTQKKIVTERYWAEEA
ncbi:MAG: CoA-acylating methylmalonate-semialdehyde dehydrogenase [Phycisphaerae bacterium]|nr:CoA-acylating methylmalonate-semialdehyde dehydrogenase [Phycisphaerae bacterium]